MRARMNGREGGRGGDEGRNTHESKSRTGDKDSAIETGSVAGAVMTRCR